MRRHAKASTAGPTQRQAGRLGRFFRGSLATRASARGVTGSGAPSVRRLAPAGVLGAFVLVILLTASAAPAAAAECPNEIRRQEQGVAALALPDCRAFENASPGTYPQQWEAGGSRGARTAIDGNSYAYFEFYPGTGFENSSLFYFSRRGTDGWSPETAAPQQTPGAIYTFPCDPQLFYSRDLSRNVLQTGFHFWYWKRRAGCKQPAEVIDPGENHGYRNLFMHDNGTGAYELLSAYPEGTKPSNSQVEGFTPDLDTVVFSAIGTDLTPDSPPGFNYYVASESSIRLLGILPDGTPYEGSETEFIAPHNQWELIGLEPNVHLNAKLVGADQYALGGAGQGSVPGSIGGDSGGSTIRHSISADGKRVFFYAGGALYMRINPAQPQSAIAAGECTEPAMACTVQIDKSQGPGSDGGGRMSFASEDGTKVFYTSAKKMTADSTATTGKEDLYEYNTETEALTDLTVNAGEPANVQNVTWASDDGSYVFFVAQAALAPGAIAGNCHDYVEGNFCNLYMEHEGMIAFIASLPIGDLINWGYRGELGIAGRENHGISRMESSPSGRYFVFQTSSELTGYDSEGQLELYLYDTSTDQLDCVSCPASGSSKGVWSFNIQNLDGAQASGPITRVTDNGRVFFETEDQLVPEDSNESVDVYEYEGGQRYLLSGGKGDNNAHFQDATPDGSNAFFVTAEPILASDVDGASTIYDARTGGGFAEPPPLPGCEGEACRGAGTSSPGAAATGTAAFQGAGNLNQGHKRNCGIAAKRAQKVSRVAKRLRRKAKRVHNRKVSMRLRHRSVKFAKKSRRLSKGAKRCRRANRRAGK